MKKIPSLAAMEMSESKRAQNVSKIKKWKWKESGIMTFQLIAYGACNMAFSLIIPFFPGEVSL